MNADQLFDDFLKKKPAKGRGKKQCPECGQLVGVRSYTCKCGHEFIKGSKKLTQKELDAENDKATDEELLYARCVGSRGGTLIYAASGRSRIGLTKITQDAVDDYCEDAVFEGLSRDRIMTLGAIKHWMVHDLGYNSKEYKQAAEMADDWYNRKIGMDISSGDEYNV